MTTPHLDLDQSLLHKIPRFTSMAVHSSMNLVTSLMNHKQDETQLVVKLDMFALTPIA